MRKPLYSGLAFLLVIGCIAQTTFSPAGWVTAAIDGKTYARATSQLPSAWAVATVGTKTTIVTAVGSSRRGNQSGTERRKTQGRVIVGYVASRPSAPPPGRTWALFRTGGESSSIAGASRSTASATASGNCITLGVSSEASAIFPNRQYQEDSNAEQVQRFQGRRQLTWTLASGIYSAPVTFQASDLFALTTASNGGGGGNAVAASGSSSSAVWVEPSGIGFHSDSSTVAGTVPCWVEVVNIEVRNSYGAHLDLWGVEVSDGSFDMLFTDYPAGDYRLYIWALGTLRTRVDIHYDPSVGVSGLRPTFRSGDLDWDNFVSPDEVAYVLSQIGRDVSTTEGALDFSETGFHPVFADLDHDGVVSLADYSLALVNMGQAGDA